MKRLSECLGSGVSKSIGEVLQLSTVWRLVVGTQNAEISVPVRFNSGKLTVAVFDNIFIQGLSFIKEDIIEKLQQHDVAVKEIVFVFKPKYVKPKKKIQKRKITEQEAGFIERLSMAIDDPKLRKGYRSALEKYFGVYSLEEFLSVEKE